MTVSSAPARIRRRTALCLAAAATLLAACGVEPESSKSALPAAPVEVRALAASGVISGPAAVQVPARRLNESLASSPAAGRMIGTQTFDNTLRGVDLAIGRYSSLAGNAQLAGIGVSRADATVETRRDRSVFSGAVLTVDDCLEERDETICVLFTDRDGNRRGNNSFNIAGRFPGPAKVSFDGSHVVIDRSDRVAGASVLSMFTIDGDYVSGHAQTAGLDRRGAYDWLPDGRLVFSVEGNSLLGDDQPTGFFITNPFDTFPQRRISMPEFYQGGRIETIESSPDGTSILMNIEPRVGPTRPVLVNLETLIVTQLIDRDDGSLIDAKSVVWGPNGKWIYVVVATSKLLTGPALGGGTIVFIGSFDSLFAYQADKTRQPMPLEPDDLSDAVRLIPTDDPDQPGGAVGGGVYKGNLAWIP